MLLISQHSCVWITLVLMTISCMQSHATVSFYFADVYAEWRFDGTVITKLSAEILELGPTFPDPPKGFDGMIVLANPADGCQAIAPPPNATDINPFGKWIAFMKMGNCDVTVKTRNAQNANYHMALIDNGLNMMYCGITQYDRNVNTSDIKINTVVVPKGVGIHVKLFSSYDKGIVMNVMKDFNDPINCKQVLVEDIENEKRDWIIQCRSSKTEKLVPLPHTWTV